MLSNAGHSQFSELQRNATLNCHYESHWFSTAIQEHIVTYLVVQRTARPSKVSQLGREHLLIELSHPFR